eukprot:UN17226
MFYRVSAHSYNNYGLLFMYEYYRVKAAKSVWPIEFPTEHTRGPLNNLRTAVKFYCFKFYMPTGCIDITFLHETEQLFNIISIFSN